MFNIIARKTLLEFCDEYPEAANALKEWYHAYSAGVYFCNVTIEGTVVSQKLVKLK